MLTGLIEKVGHLKRRTQIYGAYGITFAEAIANNEILLRNTDFRLIHVQQEDGRANSPVMVVTPALDRSIRREVRKQGYFTVSHLWGSETEQKLWTDHGIIGICGQVVQVKIRPEKQKALLYLLQSCPGFWWIDVFCAQSKTPPSIMGDVYRFCNKCVALVDFRPDGFPRIEAVSRRLQCLQTLDDLVGTYKERINGRMCSTNQSWFESLDDILGGWYDGDPADIKALADFFSCQWFTRVWTLQEYLLPPSMSFVSEADPMSYSFGRPSITTITDTVGDIASQVFVSYIPSATRGDWYDFHFSLSNEQYEYASRTPGLSRCYFDLSRFNAFQLYKLFDTTDFIPGGNLMTFRRGSSKLDLLIIVLTLLARLPRTCMYPRDFIYGVSGLLGMNIPMAENDEEVWASFRKIVHKRAPYVEVPEKSPLSGAANMQDVYEIFVGVDIRAYMATFNEYVENL